MAHFGAGSARENLRPTGNRSSVCVPGAAGAGSMEAGSLCGFSAMNFDSTEQENALDGIRDRIYDLHRFPCCRYITGTAM